MHKIMVKHCKGCSTPYWVLLVCEATETDKSIGFFYKKENAEIFANAMSIRMGMSVVVCEDKKK